MDTINIYFLWDIVFPSTSIWNVESFKRQQVNNHAPHHSQQQGRRCKSEDVHPTGALGQTEQACFRHESRSTRHQCIPDKVSSTLQHHYRQAQLEGKQLTAGMLKQRFMATRSNPPSLLEMFDKQVKDADRLAHAGQINMSHSNRHKLVYRRLEEFCKKMGRQNMPLEQFNRQMIHELELFFRTDCRLSINTTAKMMSMVRKGILWAYRCGIILTNPFSTYRIKRRKARNNTWTSRK